MLTDLSWFKTLKWILGLIVATGLVLWFFLFQFPYYDSFSIFLQEQLPYLAGVVLLTLLGFQFGFLPVEQFIQRQSELNLYLQRVKRFGQILSQTTTRDELIGELTAETPDLFPYEEVAVFEYDEDNQGLLKVGGEQGGLDQIRSRRLLDQFEEQNIGLHDEDSPFTVWNWSGAVTCPVAGLSGPIYLIVLRTENVEQQATFHRVLGRMLSEQVGDALRQIEQLEREQAIQDQLNEEIQRNTEEIRQQRQFLSSILDSLDEGLIVINEHNEIERINPTALDLMNTVEPQTNARLSSLKEHLPNELLENRDQTEPRTVQFDDKTLEYEWHPVENTDNKLLVFRDRTRVEQLQERLRINETLSTLGEMASAIVHELRNPLGGMEIYLGLLKRKIDDEELDKPIRQLEQGFKSIQNTTETLLNYTKTSHPTPEEIDPNQLIDAALEKCRDAIDSNQVNLENNLPDLPSIEGDFEQLHNVFVNLIRNGIEAQEDKPSLEILGNQEDDFISISVRDQGEGMTEEERNSVFDRFFTTKSDGTGLGLAICKRMVEMHSGDIDVDSTPGEGSTFTVRLPVHIDMIETTEEEAS